MRALMLIGAVSIAGCFSPDFQDVNCGPMGECPPGHLCNTPTGLCERSEDLEPDPIDASTVDAPEIDAVPAPADANTECDPVNQATCPDDQMCAYVATNIDGGGTQFTGYTACVPRGSGDFNDLCMWNDFDLDGLVSNCGRGLMCPSNADGARCTNICSIANGDICIKSATECRAHAGGIFEDRNGVGLCTGD